MESLDALFYPQIVCLNETLLKYILLVFDRITFLPNDIDLPSGHDSVKKRFSINDDILFSVFGTQRECLLSGMYSSESIYWNDEIKQLVLLGFLWIHVQFPAEEQNRYPEVLKFPEPSCG